jgi:hypothetical protein
LAAGGDAEFAEYIAQVGFHVRSALLWSGLACWGAGFVYHWWRSGLWLLDLLAIPGIAVLYSGASQW